MVMKVVKHDHGNQWDHQRQKERWSLAGDRLTAGVKYCGHCNPQENGPALIRKLQFQHPELKVVPWYESNFDVLLVVSACPIDCATRPDFEGPRVEIAAGEVRTWLIPAGHPAEFLLQALRARKSPKLEKGE